MIMVMGGTTEGRLAAKELEQAGFNIVATAVTPYGKRLLEGSFKGVILCGAMDTERLYEAVRQYEVELLVDATHPFAFNASQNAREVCAALNIHYLRFERQGEDYGGYPDENLIKVENIEEAVLEAGKIKGSIFLTLGSSKLEKFVDALGRKNLVARILPTSKSLCICEELSLSPQQIIAAQGPFSKDFNKEMFIQYKASAVVTKESGKTGGLPQKLAAAEELGLKVILIKRPSSLLVEKTFSSVDELKEYIISINFTGQ